MNDPRLSSIHLEALPRRGDYRKARQRLLDACGTQTLAIDGHYDADYFAREQRTLDHAPPANQPPSAILKNRKFWLTDQDRVIQLKVGLNTIGRMPDNDIAITDCAISRRHCAILVHVSARCELHDTASKNGTHLNGKRIAGPTPLNPGDEIRICDHKFIFHAGDQPPSLPAAPANEDPGGNNKTHVD